MPEPNRAYLTIGCPALPAFSAGGVGLTLTLEPHGIVAINLPHPNLSILVE